MTTMKELKERLNDRIEMFNNTTDDNPIDYDYYEVHAIVFDMLNDMLSDVDEDTNETYHEEKDMRQRVVERLASCIGYDDEGAVAAAEILAMLK